MRPRHPNPTKPHRLSWSYLWKNVAPWPCRNNLELKADLINPTIAAERLSEEEAKFEASFFANASYGTLQQPGQRYVEIEPGTWSYVPAESETEQINADLGVQVPLSTGGRVTFDLAETSYNDLNGDPNENPYYQHRASVSVSQPLLRNAGKWANMHSIRLAAYDRQNADARAKLDVITVLAAIDRVYWRLYAGSERTGGAPANSTIWPKPNSRRFVAWSGSASERRLKSFVPRLAWPSNSRLSSWLRTTCVTASVS